MQQLSLSRLPWWGQIAAFVLLALGGVYGVETYYIAEMTTEAQQKEVRLTQLRADIVRGLGTARRLPEFRAYVADLERRLEALKAVLPEQKDVGDLLRRIQTLATQSNLTIRMFTPQAIAVRQLHAEWPIGLRIDGSYHNLGLFFDRISKFPRIINVSNIRISARDRQDPNNTITAECTATTFVLLERTVPPPAPGAAPAAPGAAVPPGAAPRTAVPRGAASPVVMPPRAGP